MGPGTAILLAVLIVILCGVFYFLPTIVAFRRGHLNRNAILILNLCLGWTALGWIGALVWSLTANTYK